MLRDLSYLMNLLTVAVIIVLLVQLDNKEIVIVDKQQSETTKKIKGITVEQKAEIKTYFKKIQNSSSHYTTYFEQEFLNSVINAYKDEVISEEEYVDVSDKLEDIKESELMRKELKKVANNVSKNSENTLKKLARCD